MSRQASTVKKQSVRSEKTRRGREQHAFSCMLAKAAECGTMGPFEWMLSSEWGQRATREDLLPALSACAQEGRVAMMKRLLEKHAGWTALLADGEILFYAVKQGSVGCVEALHEAGANLDGLNEYAKSPLEKAAESGDIGMVKKLLSLGASPNGVKGANTEPLLTAAAHGHLECAKALLDAGAKPNRIDEAGMSSLTYAVLLQKGEDPERCVELAKILVEAGASVNASDSDGWTALHYAAERNHVAMARFLLKSGADPSLAAEGDSSIVPLDLALDNKSAEVAQLLLDCVAPTTSKGWSAMAKRAKLSSMPAFQAKVLSLRESFELGKVSGMAKKNEPEQKPKRI